jgi:ATP-dependent HslUV protease ATP-binding subunit HslU
LENLTPREIVRELDKFIIGQDKAKRAVAIALRNRFRRRQLPADLQEEIVPKNILMIGPTGVGKTEIARRLAKLVNAPFVKVEATKFTEVGYVGRDVDSIVRDLVETSVRMVKNERIAAVRDKADQAAQERLLDILVPVPKRDQTPRNPLAALFGSFGGSEGDGDEGEERGQDDFQRRIAAAEGERREVGAQLAAGSLEERVVEIEVEDANPPMLEVFSGGGSEELGINLQDLFGGMLPRKRKKRRVTVAEARKILTQEEAQKMVDMDEVSSEAVRRAEQTGIVFVDEMDKIAGREKGSGPDVSREGVQRDILPIVEGSTVVTKYGPAKTDHVLFIAAGAFHVSKPSDLIPELQGRFPIRVELTSLSRDDFIRILVEPENALIKQYTALLGSEGVELVWLADGIEELADMALKVNEQSQNIGARRLHTVIERLLEEVSFAAPDPSLGRIEISREFVREKLSAIVKNEDLSRYIL